MQVPRSITLLIRIQELLVVAQQLVAYGGGLVVAGEVAHVGEHVTRKVDVAAPPIGLIIPLIQDQPTSLDHLTVETKYVQRCVVAAGTRSGSERQDQTTPFGINLLRSQVLYRAAQAGQGHLVSARLHAIWCMINGADVAALPPSLLMTAQGMHCRAGMLQHTLLHWAATHMSAC